MSEQQMEWGGFPFIVDDGTNELFEISALDLDPDQQPAFRVTSSTAALVKLDFELYKPSLERMVNEWREEKARALTERASQQRRAGNSR